MRILSFFFLYIFSFSQKINIENQKKTIKINLIVAHTTTSITVVVDTTIYNGWYLSVVSMPRPTLRPPPRPPHLPPWPRVLTWTRPWKPLLHPLTHLGPCWSLLSWLVFTVQVSRERRPLPRCQLRAPPGDMSQPPSTSSFPGSALVALAGR